MDVEHKVYVGDTLRLLLADGLVERKSGKNVRMGIFHDLQGRKSRFWNLKRRIVNMYRDKVIIREKECIVARR